MPTFPTPFPIVIMSNPTVTGTGGSPSKGRRHNEHATLKNSLQNNRNEERAFMHGRVWQIDEPNDFSKIFFPPDVHAVRARTNIFKDPPPFSSEPAMYDWIVSTFVLHCHSTMWS